MLRVLGRIVAGGFLASWSLHASAQAAASFPGDEKPAAAPTTSAPKTPSTSPTPSAAAPTSTQPTAPAAPATAAPTTAAPATAAPTTAPAPATATPAATTSSSGDLHLDPIVPNPNKKPSRFLSLTISPLHLLSPIVEVQVEVMPTPHFGIAAIGGAGSIKANTGDSTLGNERFSAYELGMQLVGYPLRDFSSLQLGGEVMWIKVSTENYGGREITAQAGGVAIGPFVGYKLLTEVGFTLFVQGGFQYVAARAKASDNQGATATDEQEAWIPLLNLNLGWSF